VSLDDLAVIVTSYSRPWYSQPVLESWSRARGIAGVHSFTLALGWHDKQAFTGQLRNLSAFREATGLGERARWLPDSSEAARSNGMHRVIAEAAQHVLEDPAVRFLVFGEEDITVSTDVLEYVTWAREVFAQDERVLCVCAHSPGGQGWDPKVPIEDADADQETVRLLPYFNSWVWGTWRERWERVLEPSWDWDCNSGGALDSGYDHNLHRRVIPQGNYLCAVPDASRSQNIGRDGGWAANPADFWLTQAPSFRADRGAVAYRLVTAREQAA
jgi:hypothetical protein